jgi:hypothetical protein
VTGRARRARGAQTQRIVAAFLAGHGWPYATDAGAGRQGRDVLGTPGLAFEVKGRRDLDLTGWLRQAATCAGGDLPLVVHRPDGYGPARIADWPVTLRLEDAVALLRAAGYGDPPGMAPTVRV